MRRAAALVGDVLTHVASIIGPGVTTVELDASAEEIIRDSGARPAFKGYAPRGYEPFPGTLCTSVNDVVVHGIPSDYELQEGDIVSVDCGVELNGFFGDYAYTFAIGEISDESKALLSATKQSLYEGISESITGRRLGDVGHAVQTFCESHGYGVVRDLCGHGIGRRMHEDPQVPNVGRRGTGKKLKTGLAFCLEPMINEGTADVSVDNDGWTVRTADGLASAHFEHTLVVGPKHPDVLSSYDSIEAALVKAGAWFPVSTSTTEFTSSQVLAHG